MYRLDSCVAHRASSFLGGKTLLPGNPLEHLLAACGRSGPFVKNVWKKYLEEHFLGGINHPPPSSTPWRPVAAVYLSLKIFGTNVFGGNFFVCFGGEPLYPPSMTPSLPADAVSHLDKIKYKE